MANGLLTFACARSDHQRHTTNLLTEWEKPSSVELWSQMWRVAVEHASGHEHKVYRSKIDKSGRIVLPAEVRTALGVGVGDSVMVIQEGMAVEIVTPQQALRQAQEYFMKLAPPEVSFV